MIWGFIEIDFYWSIWQTKPLLLHCILNIKRSNRPMITLIFDFNIKKWNNDSTMESYHEWRENNVVCCIVYFWCCKLHTAVVWILTADIRYIAIHWIHIAMHLAASCKNHRRIKDFCKIIKVMSYKYMKMVSIYNYFEPVCLSLVLHLLPISLNWSLILVISPRIIRLRVAAHIYCLFMGNWFARLPDPDLGPEPESGSITNNELMPRWHDLIWR